MNEIKSITEKLYITTERIIFYIRHQNYYRSSNLLNQWISLFSDLAKLILNPENSAFSVDASFIKGMLQNIIGAQESDNYTLIADFLENDGLQLIRFISTKLQENAPLDRMVPGDDKTYNVSPSLHLIPTLSVTENRESWNLCSISNPIREALTLTDNYYNVNSGEYIVLGLGLGYLPMELYLRCDKSVPVTVFECDMNIIDIATSSDYLREQIDEDFKIVYDPDLSKFSNALLNLGNGTMIIHAPSMNNIENPVIRKRVNELFIQDSSIKNQLCEMLSNFRKNVVNCNHYVDELKPHFENKDVYLIAAGPSLDKNINLLKDKPANSIILAVGSVYKKLINLGINPDYVVFLDCKKSLFSQVDGITDVNTPMIIASTACADIAKKCSGEKYLVCQNGLYVADAYAELKHYNTYETGGSVSTIAFDIAVKLGAKRIITLGLDLALTNGKMHAEASGTQSISSEGKDMVEVPGYFGETVVTTPNMEMYRQWFMNYIKEFSGGKSSPEFINATEGGSMIDGMTNKPLSDII